MSDSPFSLFADPVTASALEAFSGTDPNTTPTDFGTSPTSSSAKPLLSPEQTTGLVNAVIGGAEDALHSFGIGAGSAATQAREAAAAQAAQQQQLLLIGLGAVLVGVVLYRMGYLGGGAS